jgi:hypothetical protein
MNVHDATEQAYKNGYEAGFKKAENIYFDKEKLSKEENKIWILLDEDLKTPYFTDIGDQSQFESNKVMPLIVAAKTREEAIKFLKWAPVKKNATILEPMVVKADVHFKPAKIIFD